MNKTHWNTLWFADALPEKLICELICLSYHLVVKSLLNKGTQGKNEIKYVICIIDCQIMNTFICCQSILNLYTNLGIMHMVHYPFFIFPKLWIEIFQMHPER